MNVVDILESVRSARGSNLKKEILGSHKESRLLRKILCYGLDPFMPFNVVKIPKTKLRVLPVAGSEEDRFEHFFSVADACFERSLSGNAAIEALQRVFALSTKEEEQWMRKILKKHLSIGASTTTVNKIFPGLVPTFEVSLAHKFDIKRVKGRTHVAVEPKLDGIRCFVIVEKGEALLFARSGKLITNFDDTIGKEIVKLGSGCYDGELMGKDFTDLMRQAYRKENLDTGGTYLALFDFLSLDEWHSKKSVTSCEERYEELLDRMAESTADLEMIQPVEREIAEAKYEEIKSIHDLHVSDGYEGAMIKFLDAPYKFGRGYEVMKMKEFHDVDLPILGLLEGTGKHSGKLGSVKVTFNGVDVQIGSGFSDDIREEMWKDPESFVGRVIEIRYQEVTPDGSLRFPTFVCFRNDR